ncbi:MAG: hypothetical protein K0S07_1756 [Chlamydiales bacterium]|nr:hypothetical protein [Chlamydiales bacterium]
MNEKFFALSLILSLLGAFFWLKVHQYLSFRRQKKRLRRGLAAEAEGEVLLKQQGFELKALQSSIQVGMTVDNRLFHYEIRPDAIAVKAGRVFAVEMKTGAIATNPLFKETRRQILEYYYALPVDGVLLIDVERKKISEIAFVSKRLSPQISHSSPSLWRRFSWLLLPILAALLYLLNYANLTSLFS